MAGIRVQCDRCGAGPAGADQFDQCDLCAQTLCDDCMAAGCCGQVPALSRRQRRDTPFTPVRRQRVRPSRRR